MCTDVSIERWLERLGGGACLLALGVLIARLAVADRAVLVLVVSCFASVAALRALYTHRRRLDGTAGTELYLRPGQDPATTVQTGVWDRGQAGVALTLAVLPSFAPARSPCWTNTASPLSTSKSAAATIDLRH